MDDIYIVKGAKLKCSFGSQKSILNVLNRNAFIKDKEKANIGDFKPNVNIKSFGMCSSLSNPEVASATNRNNGTLTRVPCKPAVTGKWINGKTDILVSDLPALLKCSTNMCMWCGKITIEEDGQ